MRLQSCLAIVGAAGVSMAVASSAGGCTITTGATDDGGVDSAAPPPDTDSGVDSGADAAAGIVPFVPSNIGSLTTIDTTALAPVTLAAATTIDSDVDDSATLGGATGSVVYQLVTQSDGTKLGVYVARSWTIASGVTVHAKGAYPLVLVATGAIDISGTLDASSAKNVPADTLTADQRTALVTVVSAHAAEHGPKDGARPHMDHAGGPGGLGPMGHLLEGLNLTAGQQQTIKAKLDATRPTPPSDADRAAMKAQHEAFRTAMQAKLQTFASDSFDATAFVTLPAGALKGPGPDHAARFAAELAIITSVLEPAQREKPALRIEAGPPAPPAPLAPAAPAAP